MIAVEIAQFMTAKMKNAFAQFKDNEYMHGVIQAQKIPAHSKWERCSVNYGCYNQIRLNWMYVATLLSDRTTTLYTCCVVYLFSFLFFIFINQTIKRTQTCTPHASFVIGKSIFEISWKQPKLFVKYDTMDCKMNNCVS